MFLTWFTYVLTLFTHIYGLSHFHTREKRRERKGRWSCRKGKAGRDRHSPCNTSLSASLLLLVLLPTIRLGQIGLSLLLLFLFLFCFSYFLVLIPLCYKNWILFCVLFLDYVKHLSLWEWCKETETKRWEERERFFFFLFSWVFFFKIK